MFKTSEFGGEVECRLIRSTDTVEFTFRVNGFATDVVWITKHVFKEWFGEEAVKRLEADTQ